MTEQKAIDQHSKRKDLQVLRGYSVLSVVIFHFFPDLLPYGYLGVDVFFVLSGYLITLVLHKKDYTDYHIYIDFYFKRIRRIVPMLSLMILFCTIYFLVMDRNELLDYNYRSEIAALIFGTNLKKLDEREEYFRKLSSATDFFTHTWSLSVEIQFYCLAPTILTIGKIISLGSFGRFIAYDMLIATVSLIYYLSLDSDTAFNSTLARLWQFISGSIVFYCEQNNSFTGEINDDSTVKRRVGLLFFPVLVALCSFIFLDSEVSTRSTMVSACHSRNKACSLTGDLPNLLRSKITINNEKEANY